MPESFAQDVAVALAATTAALAVLKPLFDALPLAGKLPTAAYNSALRIAGVAINFGLLCALLASQGALDFGHNWYVYAVAAAGQQIGSHMLYSGVKAAAASAPSVPALPALASEANAAAHDASTAPAPASVLPPADPADTLPAPVADPTPTPASA